MLIKNIDSCRFNGIKFVLCEYIKSLSCWNSDFNFVVCFRWKIKPWCSAVCIRDSAALQTGRVLGLRAFLTAHREAMDWFVSLDRLFKNTASCDARTAALEAGIQPRLLLYKWSGLHWFKVCMINVINMGFRRDSAWMSISHNLSCVTMTISSHKPVRDIGVCVWDSYSHYRANIL